MKTIVSLFILVLTPLASYGQTDTLWQPLIGSAYIDNASYGVLRRLCDEGGGRLVGSEANERAMAILIEELKGIGYQARSEPFSMPGWVRGNDVVQLTSPVDRTLRAFALGYVPENKRFEAPVITVTAGRDTDYTTSDARGKIVLLRSTPLSRGDAIRIAANHGARGMLLVNEKNGGLVLARVANMTGEPSPIPCYSITMEEGEWIERLCSRSIPVTIAITTTSHCTTARTANIVASLPGIAERRIIIGAHFDAWDLGQGAIDNGTGTAVLFDVARLLKIFSPYNYYPIDFVWFNGEELGLWGSREYVRIHSADSIAAVINMDMIGTPTGFNPMGNEEYVPFLDSLATALNGFDLKIHQPVTPWLGSDHIPFMLKGIPAFTMHSFLDDDRVRYYHDFGDTFDKVSRKYLSDAAAVVAILAHDLANRRDMPFRRRNPEETAGMFKRYKLDDRLRASNLWPFPDR